MFDQLILVLDNFSPTENPISVFNRIYLGSPDLTAFTINVLDLVTFGLGSFLGTTLLLPLVSVLGAVTALNPIPLPFVLNRLGNTPSSIALNNGLLMVYMNRP